MTEISVTIISWFEEDCIDLAIQSIRNFADEVILVDNNSQDDTVNIARDLLKQFHIPHSIYVLQGALMFESRYKAIQEASCDWVMMQDGDLVMCEKGKESLQTLRTLVEDNKNENYMYRVPDINLCGDYRHLMKKQPVNPPHKFLFNANFAVGMGERDRPKFPNHRFKKLEGVFGADLSRVRTHWRSLIRFRQHEWIKDGRYPSLIEYLENEVGTPLDTFKEHAPHNYLRYLKNQCLPIEDYFEEGVNILPELLQEELKEPRFEIIYKDDEIVGRKPDVVF